MLEIQVSDKFKTGVKYDSQVFDSQVNDKYKICEGYHAVPPPYTGNFRSPKPNLVHADEEEYVFSESITSVPAVATSKVKTSVSKPKSVSEPLIEDWMRMRLSLRNFVPKAVLMKSGHKTLNTARQNSSKAAVSVNNARPINTAYLRPILNSARTSSNVFNRAHSHVRRPFNKFTTNKNSNFNEKVNTVRENVTIVGLKVVVSDNKGNDANDVKGNPQLELQEKGVIDSRCSKHMTGNKSYLSDYEEIDGGFVAFGGNSKGGKITGKGKIRTGKLDFKDLIDENHVLLKVPRKDNMYSVDLRNVVPQGGLTCLFSKATLDESNLWNRRLGHINFKTMNKLVRGNLVTGLPSKIFENDHTCVACQKGKQHKASCTKESIDASQAGKKTVHSHEYILLPLWTLDSSISSSLKSSDDKVADDVEKKSTKDLAKEDDYDDQDLREFKSSPVNTAETKDADVNNTNIIYTASPLVNFDAYDDKEFVIKGEERHENNLESYMHVSPIATTRVHKDHLVEQIIRDLHSAPQTRRMTKNYEEHVEPKKVIKLADPTSIEAMQDELPTC
ncbi:ribonuclease H-like domain-containing protein [Tanacetum coccineum]